MRRAARVDQNQDRVVQTLRRAGIAVRVLSQVGGGVPDLLAKHRDGSLVLLEVKNGALCASARKLTPLEQKFQETWPVHIVNNEREALIACGVEVV